MAPYWVHPELPCVTPVVDSPPPLTPPVRAPCCPGFTADDRRKPGSPFHHHSATPSRLTHNVMQELLVLNPDRALQRHVVVLWMWQQGRGIAIEVMQLIVADSSRTPSWLGLITDLHLITSDTLPHLAHIGAILGPNRAH